MILVIVNNLSGNRKSLEFYNKKIKPYLDLNKYSYETIDSDNNYFITPYACTALEKYSIYIIIGGDGTLNYYINNKQLYNTNQNILCVPMGSGNGLAKNLGINTKNIFSVFEDKNIKRINLQEIQYESSNLINSPKYSFLYITWGLISDIDIDTEFLRCIGDLRFYYGIIKFLILGNVYYGKLTYIDDHNEYNEVEGEFSLFCSGSLKWISNDFNMIPCADENFINIIYINKNISFFQRCKLLYQLLNETHILNCEFIKYKRVKSYTLEKYDNISKFVYDGELLNTKKINVSNNKAINFYKNIY